MQPFLTQADTERLMHAFISSRLDYCDALLSGLPKKAINKLQIIQKAEARVLTKTRRRAHISPVLKPLHWLPVSSGIDYIILLLFLKTLNRLAPEYLSDMLMCAPSRSLGSSGSGLWVAPRGRTETYGGAAFSAHGPRLWNSLPEELGTFKTNL